ncbi:MAG: glycosyltransferase [Elusimicrobiota bacterium]
MKPLISVIIPVKNSERTIEKCLVSVTGQDYPDYEIIVVNDGSTDNTGVILEKFKKNAGVRIIETPGMGPSSARNMAMMSAKGEYVAFTDGDCIVDRDWLKELLNAFSPADISAEEKNKIAGTGGAQLSPEDEVPFGRDVQRFMEKVGFITEYIKPGAGTGQAGSQGRAGQTGSPRYRFVEHNPTCNAMYRKDIIERVGGFQKGLWPGEDVDLDYRIRKEGYLLVFNPSAMVYHYRTSSIKKFAAMMFNYGRVQTYLVKKYGFFRKIQYLPIITLLALGLIVFLLKWSPLAVLSSSALLLLGSIVYFGSFKTFYLGLVAGIFWNAGFVRGLINWES